MARDPTSEGANTPNHISCFFRVSPVPGEVMPYTPISGFTPLSLKSEFYFSTFVITISLIIKSIHLGNC